MGTYDPFGYALVVTRLITQAPPTPRASHPPPAWSGAARRGQNDFRADYAAFVASIAAASNAAPTVDAEPPLPSYVFRKR